MKRNVGRVVLFGAVGLAALAGCGQPSMPAATPLTPSATSSSAAAGAGPGSMPSAAASVLKTSSTSLGTVVVDGRGMTVYYFDKDTAKSGKSACTGGCAAMWPAVTAASSTPEVSGVTGRVGTITRDDGKMQVTVNDLPVYTYSKDMAPGDVKGQGVGGIWWAVSPAGDKVSRAASGY